MRHDIARPRPGGPRRGFIRPRPLAFGITLIAAGLIPAVIAASQRPDAPLRLEEVIADTDDAFRAVATIVAGPTESIVWDAQYKVSDGRRLAERIAATGTRLKAIVISHADHDHYMGAMAVLNAFPGTPVYMTASTLQDFNERSATDLALERKRPNADAPETLPVPRLLPAAPLTVDGHRLEIIADLGGDVRKPVSTVLWIPSIRAALVADLAFNGVHPWLGDSDMASRSAWRAALKRIADLKPNTVVPGHKADAAAGNSPELLTFMQTYLDDYDRLMQASATPAELATAMRQKYPQLRIAALMAAGGRQFKK